MKQSVLLFFALLLNHFVSAQFIVSGPVTGGLTEKSARIYVRTVAPAHFSLQISTDSGFSSIREIALKTTSDLDQSVIITVDSLNPSTKYFIRFLFYGIPDSRVGSFRTFPAPGERKNLTFVTGSCQESPNMKTFDVMKSTHPDLFIHTGDFTYPSYQMGDEYPADYKAVQISYRRRYDENRTREMLWDVPIDYIPDDDDLWGGARNACVAGHKYLYDTVARKYVLKLYTDTFPDAWRYNCVRAYTEHFPGYVLPDTSQGLYHSFTVANCEFIVMDTRSTADNSARNFRYDPVKNKWSFVQDSSLHIISPQQMAWVKERLKNSKADWKFLVSGLPFNGNIRYLIDLGIKMQDVLVSGGGESGTGFRMAISYSHYWGGFYNDHQDLMNFIHSNNLKDIIVLSGDTHHNEIDDGTNAGLPELNASGLSVAGTHLGYYMNLISRLVAYPSAKTYLWNHGGGGLGNKNFKNQFGKVEVDANKQVRLSVVDEDNLELASCVIPHSSMNVEPVKKNLSYQKRMEKRLGKGPTPWMKFVKFIASILFKKPAKPAKK
jgi:phosphodiesterase/alkaline phosphatase D-like protein